MNDLNQPENAKIEQVCEKLKTVRDSMIGDEGEFIVMGGMVNQELVGDMDGVAHVFDLAPGHFYAVVEIPIGDDFAIAATTLTEGFHAIDGKGEWS